MSSFSSVLKFDIPSPALEIEKINLATNGTLSSRHKRCFENDWVPQGDTKEKSEWHVAANWHPPHVFLDHDLAEGKKKMF